VPRSTQSRFVLGCGYAACVASCSLTALDSLSGDPDVAPDATLDAETRETAPTSSLDSGGDTSLADATSDDASTDAGVDAADVAGRPNLLQNPGFESGSSCGPPWVPYQSTLAIDTERRSGSQACRVCRQASGDSAFTIGYSGTIDATAKVGAKYRVSAYVRAKSGAPSGTRIVLRTWGPTPTTEQAQSPLVTLNATWQLVEVTGIINLSPGAVDLFVESAGASTSDCFLVDDLHAERL
jgi:hypothetical protein